MTETIIHNDNRTNYSNDFNCESYIKCKEIDNTYNVKRRTNKRTPNIIKLVGTSRTTGYVELIIAVKG